MIKCDVITAAYGLNRYVISASIEVKALSAMGNGAFALHINFDSITLFISDVSQVQKRPFLAIAV